MRVGVPDQWASMPPGSFPATAAPAARYLSPLPSPAHLVAWSRWSRRRSSLSCSQKRETSGVRKCGVPLTCVPPSAGPALQECLRARMVLGRRKAPSSLEICLQPRGSCTTLDVVRLFSVPAEAFQTTRDAWPAARHTVNISHERPPLIVPAHCCRSKCETKHGREQGPGQRGSSPGAQNAERPVRGRIEDCDDTE